MPWADYACGACGAEYPDLYYKVADVGGPHWPLRCARCETVLQYLRCPAPGVDAKEPFQRFDVARQVPVKGDDGAWRLEQRTETVDSLHKVRAIEADSERRYRDHEGEPLRFRGYAQNATNKDVGAFGTAGTVGGRAYDSGKTPQKKANLGVTRHGQKKPSAAVGPAVPKGGSSAL